MAYKSKFLHFKTKASYNAERAKTTAETEDRKVFDAYISFIDEGPMICTWGQEYKCDISASEVEALVNAGKISPATVAPLVEGTAAVGTSTKYAREDHRHPARVLTSSDIPNLPTDKITTGQFAVDRIPNLSASKITSGTINADRLPIIPIEKLPAGALERMFVAATETAAVALVTSKGAQDGDVVQVTGNSNQMYFVVDDAATTFANIFRVFTAGTATSVPWSGVTGAPTKLSQFTNDSGFTTNKGTVTSVAMSVPTGLTVSGSPITANGTLALSYTSGYSIPTTAKQTNWDTAYGWGNHASAGYAKTTQLSNYLHLSGGTLTGLTIAKNGIWLYDEAESKTRFNTTGKIGAVNTYSTPLTLKTNSAATNWNFQYHDNLTLLLGPQGSQGIQIQSLGENSIALYASLLYQGGKLVATQEWTTSNLASYLPLTGGTLTGDLTVNANYSTSSLGNIIKDNKNGALGFGNYTNIDSIYIQTKETGAVWITPKSGTNYKVYHSGNLTKLSQLSNDSGFLTSVPAQTWASITGKPSTFTPSAHTQAYTTLTGSTTTANQAIVSSGTANGWTLKTLGSLAFSSATIPTKTSQLTNDSGFLTSVPAQSWTSITGKPTFATVATSGSYNDLTDKPSIPSLSGYATQSWVTSQGYLTSIPVATSSAYGGIQIGYATSGKNYAVQLSNGKAYVNVPWTDTNTTYSAGTNISISGTTINCTYSYTLPTATGSVLGGVKVGSNITLSSGTISLSKSNVTSALGYTPANTSDIPEIPIALPNPYALTINGTSYTGSSAVSVTTSKPLTSGGNTGGTVVAGRNYNATSSSISSVSGFSYDNPDAVVGSSTKITSFPSSVRKMDGIADLSGSYYVYCFSYIGGYVYVNGAVYA